MTGNKAKNLELLQSLGLNVPGFIVVPYDEIVETTRRKINKKRLNQLVAEVMTNGWKKVSVRTSAVGEDGEKTSFAGQYTSFVDVAPDSATLKKCILASYDSVYSARVAHYAHKHGVTAKSGGAVIIQEMFYGDKSGVLFSEDGSGQAVLAYTNSWRNDVVDGQDARQIKVKKIDVDTAKIPPVLRQIVKTAIRLETEMGVPLDIEWAARGQRVAYLQVRPKTTVDIEDEFVWDSTNISESYPDITLPLTYSFIRELYANVYREFLQMVGIPRRELAKHKDVFDNMLGYVNGRVYYRISNWYEMIKLVPGKNNQTYFEAMLNPARKRGNRPKLRLNPVSLALLLRFVMMLLLSPVLSHKFKRVFQKRMSAYNDSQMQYLKSSMLLGDIQAVRRDLLALWAIPILNDIRVMIYHGILMRSFRKRQGDEYLDLLRGLTDKASIRPLSALYDLGAQLSGKQADEQIRLAEGYIKTFGARTPDELKLESPRLAEDVHAVISLAKRSITRPPTNSASYKVAWWRFGTRLIVRNLRSAVDWRERFRFNRVQVFDLARRAYLEIGRRFVEEKVIATVDDVFWLTEQEIEATINGHSWSYDLRETISQRRGLYKEYCANPLSRHVTGSGVIAARHTLDTTPEGIKTTCGQGVSAGTLSAKTVVMTTFDANKDVRGKILIARHIDPGWTLLFTQAAGVITERGNALSHVAIVARELRIPAIVGVKNATTHFRDGQTIIMNGATGEIDERES
jgi:pyruvate,water dikinase